MESLINILAARKISELTFVDVGAKDKLEFINELKSITTLHAFEPNPDEYDKLKARYKNEIFKGLHINKYGLSDHNGIAEFNVTKHNSMSSLLETDIENYEKHFGNYSEFNFWRDNVEVKKKINIELLTLDDYFQNNSNVIDYLKIDTQGSELTILKGAAKLLLDKKISVIKVEVSTIPIYKNQALFSEIDIFMREYGYILVDFITYRNEVKLALKSHNAHYAPSGDAIYVLNSHSNDAKTCISKSLVLSWLGYKSLSKNLLNTTKLSEKELSVVLSLSKNSKLLVLKTIIKNLVPPYIFNTVKSVFNFYKKLE
ncbi:MAG: FkbM family methyltransferase [Bacteroidota bacterium]|nr:FkbM family methyltransferase [Bacteroidota bacterium]